MTEYHQHNESQEHASNLDCSGAGECQPLPEETTDGVQKQNMVQRFIDRLRTLKNKKTK